jgi:hypothetical protein
MTISLTNQIQAAEHDFIDPRRRATDAGHSLREASAHLIRYSANLGLELADRLNPRPPRPAGHFGFAAVEPLAHDFKTADRW